MEDEEFIKDAFALHLSGAGKYKNRKELELGLEPRNKITQLTIEFVNNSSFLCIVREYGGNLLWHKIHYKNLKRDGPAIEYKENGEVGIKVIYKDGEEYV